MKKILFLLLVLFLFGCSNQGRISKKYKEGYAVYYNGFQQSTKTNYYFIIHDFASITTARKKIQVSKGAYDSFETNEWYVE